MHHPAAPARGAGPRWGASPRPPALTPAAAASPWRLPAGSLLRTRVPNAAASTIPAANAGAAARFLPPAPRARQPARPGGAVLLQSARRAAPAQPAAAGSAHFRVPAAGAGLNGRDVMPQPSCGRGAYSVPLPRLPTGAGGGSFFPISLFSH